jgi:molecular chaperone GrpE (heat shock protein)
VARRDLALRKEIAGLTNNLQSILDEAEALRARAEFAGLRARLRRER